MNVSLAEAAIFEYAFKLGAQMILDVLNKEHDGNISMKTYNYFTGL